MARTSKRRNSESSRIYTRNGRHYGDFRAYSDVGGSREPLIPEGQKVATKDPEEASLVYADRLRELKAKRADRTAGVEPESDPVMLKQSVADRLAFMASEKDVTDGWIEETEHRLTRALEFFGEGVDVSSIDVEGVRAFTTWLREIPNGRGGKLSDGTVRHHLNALSGLFRTAGEKKAVPLNYNPVQAMEAKPTGNRRPEADWLDVPDASLLLEAARRYVPEKEWSATPGLYALLATFLLTGARKSEVLGLMVDDVSFDRDTITFRSHPHRRLKTSTSHRTIPIWPQLREILQAHIFGGDSPRTEGLLFPGRDGKMIRDLRKVLDAVAEKAGIKDKIRTKVFRHTYCAARLQTAQRVMRPGATDPSDPTSYDWVPTAPYTVGKELGHGGTAMVERVYGHLGTITHRSEVVEYRVEQHKETLGERLTALVAAT